MESESDLNKFAGVLDGDRPDAGFVPSDDLRRRAVRVTHAYFRDRKGVDVAYSVYRPRSGLYDQVLIVVPELGACRSFYTEFATYLAYENVVVTFDPAGTGDSRDPGRHRLIGMRDWIGDLEYLMKQISEQFGRTLVGVGHGIGGVVLTLCSPEYVKKLLLVASADLNFRHWPRLQQAVVVGRWAFGYANAAAGGVLSWKGAVRAPTPPPEVVRDCASWCISGHLLGGSTLMRPDLCAGGSAPALIVFADDDSALAPRAACLALVAQLKPLEAQLLQLYRYDWPRGGIRHGGYFQDVTGPRLWQQLARWIQT